MLGMNMIRELISKRLSQVNLMMIAGMKVMMIRKRTIRKKEKKTAKWTTLMMILTDKNNNQGS